MNTKTPKKRHIDKKVQQCVSASPCMEFSCSNVSLNISSRCLEIKSLDTNDVVARHDMPRISFASGGDLVGKFSLTRNLRFNAFCLQDTLDYVAYVAKDVTEWRACYVLECGNEKAQSLISTLGIAFELRYKEYYGNEA